jgi:hypothetical protein
MNTTFLQYLMHENTLFQKNLGISIYICMVLKQVFDKFLRVCLVPKYL